ncbi:MAG: starch-binding protein [Clostridia bacterium]|nr:starch-binding protein [Clostridia bacterium]
MKKTRFFALVLAFLMIMSSFTFAVSADILTTRQALADKIQQAENSYPPPGSNPLNGTVAALSNAIDQAVLVLNDESSTEAELQKQIENLDNAIKGIVILDLDNSKLWEAMVLANSLNAEDYTEESYEAMKAVANDYFVLHYAQSQKEIDDATARIYQAILDLVPVGTATVPYIDEELYTSAKQRFLDALSAAEEQLQQVGGNYNNETYRVFIDAYEKAMAIYESGEELTGEEYLALAEELEEAIAGIEYFHWDTDELWKVIESCEPLYEDIKNGMYFYDTFLDKYHEENHNASMALYYGQSQEEVDNAAKALKEAARRLIPQDDIKGELEEEVKLTEEFNLPNEDNYTKSSFEQVVLLYQYSKGILAENTQETTMLQAIYDLRDAKDRLTLKSDSPSNTATEVTEATEVVTATALNTDPAEITTAPTTTANTEPVETTEATATATNPTYSAEATTLASDTEPTESATASASQETTVASATTEVIPTVKPQLSYMIGDADKNFKINIKDATVIQKHLAKLITLSDIEIVAGDANGDGKLNVKDATEIQKHLANLPSNNHIGIEIVIPDTTPAETTVIPWATETIPETPTQASTDDEGTTIVTAPATTVTTEPNVVTSASTSEATTETAVHTETTAQATTETVPFTTESIFDIYEEDIIIYFCDKFDWKGIYIYYWNDQNTQDVFWPGTPMKLIQEDPLGNIYAAEVPACTKGIIFSGAGGEYQCEELYNFKNADGFYPVEGKDGTWELRSMFIGQEIPVDCKSITNQRIYGGYSSEGDYIFLVRNEADKKYEELLNCEFPEVNTEDLAQRGKAAIVILTCIGSGDSTLTIDSISLYKNGLYVSGLIDSPLMGTPDMNYRFVVIEVNLNDVEGVERCFYNSVKNYG